MYVRKFISFQGWSSWKKIVERFRDLLDMSRPEAASQAWEELAPMSFARLLALERPLRGFVDVGLLMASTRT